jgi:hypothetical protein
MNARIRKLAEQADILFYKEHIPDTGFVCEGAEVTKEDLQRFAELLIKECILVARKAENEDEVYAWYAISNHFGVEE